jgi:hypothetical protein
MTQSDDNWFDDYTDQAVDAITRAARTEGAFLAWLVAVLAAVASEFKSSHVPAARRPAFSEAGQVQGPAGGTVGWNNDARRDYSEE